MKLCVTIDSQMIRSTPESFRLELFIYRQIITDLRTLITFNTSYNRPVLLLQNFFFTGGAKNG